MGLGVFVNLDVEQKIDNYHSLQRSIELENYAHVVCLQSFYYLLLH